MAWFPGIGTMKSIGMELSADYTAGKLVVHGNVSWKHMLEYDGNIGEKGIDRTKGDPKFSANATVSYQLLPGLRLHANAHCIGKRYLRVTSHLDENQEWVFGSEEAPAVVLFDIGANWNWRRLGVNVNIHNLLGKEYWQSGSSISYTLPQQRRWLLVELTYRI